MNLIMFLVLSLGVFANAESALKMTTVSFEQAYVPIGFDSNDNVQVVGEGTFPNACYKTAGVSKKVDLNSKTIYIQQKAYQFPPPCFKMLVRFNNVVDIGILPPGNYQVKDMKTKENLGHVKVTPAKTTSADDYLYAPVSEAIVRPMETVGNHVVLSGAYSNSCLYVKEIKVNREAPDVVTLLPISEMRTGQECLSGIFRFSKVVQLPEMSVGRYLLHVRVLNGNSINKLFDIYW